MRVPAWRGYRLTSPTDLDALTAEHIACGVSHILELGQRLRAFAALLLLLGTHTAPFLTAATEFLAATMPNSRVLTLEGEGHVAMNTAPELFAREVLAFLLSGVA